jgi:hypothetical protein
MRMIDMRTLYLLQPRPHVEYSPRIAQVIIQINHCYVEDVGARGSVVG